MNHILPRMLDGHLPDAAGVALLVGQRIALAVPRRNEALLCTKCRVVLAHDQGVIICRRNFSHEGQKGVPAASVRFIPAPPTRLHDDRLGERVRRRPCRRGPIGGLGGRQLLQHQEHWKLLYDVPKTVRALH